MVNCAGLFKDLFHKNVLRDRILVFCFLWFFFTDHFLDLLILAQCMWWSWFIYWFLFGIWRICLSTVCLIYWFFTWAVNVSPALPSWYWFTMFCCVVVVSNCGTAWWPFTVPCLRTQPSHRFHGLPISTWRFLHMWQTWLTYKFCYNLCHNLCQLHGGVKMDTNDSFTWKKRRRYHTFSSSPLSLEPQGWGATVPGYPQASGHRVPLSGNCVAFNLHVCWHQGRREQEMLQRMFRFN